LKRVAFFMPANPSDWLGGLSYLRNLLTAICSNERRRIEPLLLAHPEVDESSLNGFPEIEVIRTSLVSHRHPLRLGSRILYSTLDRDLTLDALLKKHRVDLLSHSTVTGMRSKVVTVGWLPDFQHIRMPQYFSREEVHERNQQFRRLIDGSKRIILSSHDAQRDFATFAPDALGRSQVLHFVSFPSVVSCPLPRDQLLMRYGVDRPYFHLPNQFWTHKNHAVVIDALSILKKRGVNLLVLATGKTADHRDPLHFERLMGRARDLGVDQSFRALGVVPLSELQSLMLNAIAVINPSNFEGWSTTVEESKSLGLPIVLSDIPVHIEQAPMLGRYFKAGSAESLADALVVAVREHDPTIALQARKQAAIELPERIKCFGRTYDEIAMAAIMDAHHYQRN
jgi:glycosyltransferase involved in cell wall biosynthesis